MSYHSAFSTRFGKVRGICVYQQYHVASFVANFGIWVSGNVIEELGTCIRHCLCGVGLL